MSDEIVTAHIIETGQSDYSNKITVSGHEIIADEPNETYEGGGDLGPAPFDLLTSSLAACTIMTMRWYAKIKGLPLERAEAIITFDRKAGRFSKEITLHGDALSDTDRQKLIEVAGKCPVQKTLLGEITVDTLVKD